MQEDDNIITGRQYLTGEAIRITLNNRLIAGCDNARAEDDTRLIIAPGLTDLQVNGYAGLDLNAYPLIPETVRDISIKLYNNGVTTFLPTIITNSSEKINSSVSAVAEACRLFPEAAGAVGGIHLEGPFISPEDGARGAHPAEHVKPPNWDLFSEWQAACGGIIRIITLSPEWHGAVDFIRRVSESGVIVSLGHSSATPDQIREAVAAGATLSTHLGNGSHQMLPRHRNYIWEQLAADELYATIISDGFHLPDTLMKVFLRVKPEKIMLVSDSTNLTGMPPGNYNTHIGGEVTLTEEGKLHIKGYPEMLAGSAKSLLHCIETIVSKGLATLAEALDMAGCTPYRFAGIHGVCRLVSGGVADLVLLSEESGGLKLVRTVKAGKTVFRTEI